MPTARPAQAMAVRLAPRPGPEGAAVIANSSERPAQDLRSELDDRQHEEQQNPGAEGQRDGHGALAAARLLLGSEWPVLDLGIRHGAQPRTGRNRPKLCSA